MTAAAPRPGPTVELHEESPVRWRIERRGAMRVPGVVFASRALLPDLASDQSLRQVADVATLPGIVEASYAMPDVHWGYGFPIGGVAATDVARGGVVSPGGVGFDISCGVRLLVSPLHEEALAGRLEPLLDELGRHVPRGMGPGGVWHLAGDDDLTGVLTGGSRYAVEHGHGTGRDLDRCEDRGAVAGADPAAVSDRALRRGYAQVGSLGSGNHFLEVQVVDVVHDAGAAAAFGLALIVSLDSLLLMKTFERMTHARHDSQREIARMGIANTVAACVGAIPCSMSLAASCPHD